MVDFNKLIDVSEDVEVKDDIRNKIKSSLKNSFLELENKIESLISTSVEGIVVDFRSVAIAKTELQTSCMWAIRSLYSDEERMKH